MAIVGGRVLLRLLLAVIVLVPTGVLFTQEWQSTTETDQTATQERAGVAYLSGMGALSVALAQADTSIAAGQAPQADAVSRAVDALSSLDRQFGDGLRSHERWSDLRAKIQALPRGAGDPAAAGAAYGSVQDLLLALYAKVQTTSKLILDPVADSYYLQAVAAAELPAAIAATSHLVDVAAGGARAAGGPATSGQPTGGQATGGQATGGQAPGGQASGQITAGQAVILVELAGARESVLAPSGRVMDDLTLAEEATSSTTLSSTLLGQVDKFQLAVQALTALTAPAAVSATVKQGQNRLRQAADDLVASAETLATSVLVELDKLLAGRISAQQPQRRMAVAALGVAALLVLLVAVLPMLRPGRRSVRAGTGRPPRSAGPAPADPTGAFAGATPPAVPPWPTGGPAAGSQQPIRREWSGAAR